jgi:hypothetical protein
VIHPYNPVGARIGECGVCGQHYTHEDHYPADPIQPATDEEVERLRTSSRFFEEHHYVFRCDEASALVARIDAERAAREKAEAETARLGAVVASYPEPTTNLAGWAKPTIALIDEGALQAISPVEDEDEDGGTPWPKQCIGALIDGFLDLASDVGKHDRHADLLVHNAIDETRKIAAELRSAWAAREKAEAERDAALGALTCPQCKGAGSVRELGTVTLCLACLDARAMLAARSTKKEG